MMQREWTRISFKDWDANYKPMCLICGDCEIVDIIGSDQQEYCICTHAPGYVKGTCNMLVNGQYFFWGGICSQWAHAVITIDGFRYNCNEQYMMAEKARLFDDVDSLNEILGTNDPSTQKFIGRHVKDFDITKWQTIARLVVYRANLAKFTQHTQLWEELLSLGQNTEIVEASPQDTIWGIGLHEDDPDCLDRSKWKGLNWLGIAIIQARSDILTMRAPVMEMR